MADANGLMVRRLARLTRHPGLAWLGCLVSILVVVLLLAEPRYYEGARRRLFPADEREWQPTSFWSAMVGYHTRLDPTAADATFFIGDSLVQGLNVGAIAQRAVNYGIGNDRIDGVRRRLPLYRSLADARAIVIAIGINDLLWRPAAEVATSYQEMLAALPPQVPLYLSAVLPVDGRVLKAVGYRTRPEIEKLNESISGLCRARPGCVAVDIGPALRDGDGDLAGRFHIGDGLHLNTEGYLIWISALSRALGADARPCRE